MTASNRTFAGIFGLCVIIVSLCSGCASNTNVNRMPMSAHDLNYFRPDCSKKEQQIFMLQSMRPTMEEQWAASFQNIVTPLAPLTDANGYRRRHEISSGRINTLITYNLQVLRGCP